MPDETKRQRRQRLVKERLNPTSCTCEFVERERGEFLHKETYRAWPYTDPSRTVEHDVVRCLRCGKKYVDAPAMA